MDAVTLAAANAAAKKNYVSKAAQRAARRFLAAQRYAAAFPSVMASPPTTHAFTASGAVSPITGSSPGITPCVPWTSPKLTVLGARLTKYSGAQAGQANNNPVGPGSTLFSVEFDIYTTAGHFAARLVNLGGTTASVWLWVDGQPATAAAETIGTAASNAPCYYDVTLASPGWHRIRLDMWGFGLAGIERVASDVIAATRRPLTKVSILGDSWSEFMTGATTPVMGWPTTLGRLLGAEVFVHGQGGTGYVKTGTSGRATYTDATRIAGVLANSPDLVIVQGSTNDDTFSVTGAAASVFAQLAPTPVFVVGPPPTNSLTSTAVLSRLVNRTQILTEANAAANVVGVYDQLDARQWPYSTPPAWVTATAYNLGDLVTSGGWVWECAIPHTSSAAISQTNFIPTSVMTGTGYQGATNSSGPSDNLLFTDQVHPTQLGHDNFGRNVSEQILSRMTAIALA